MGFLAGTEDISTEFIADEFRGSVPRLKPENRDANKASVDVLEDMPAEKNATAARIALAWLLAQKPWIAPIPSTTKRHRPEENLAAADVQLTADDLRRIEESATQIRVHGHRRFERSQRMIDR